MFLTRKDNIFVSDTSIAMAKKGLLIICTLLFLTACSFNKPVSECPDYRIYIRPADNTESVIQSIVQSDPEANIKPLKFFLDRRDYVQHIHTGCYTIKNGATPKEVSDMLLSGNQTPVRLTINSTRTIGQMARAIANQVMVDSAAIASRLNDPVFLDSMGYTPTNVFCMIIPNTYEVYWNTSADALLARLVKERNRYWTDERKAKAKSIGLSEEDVIILASIIEEETAKVEEFPIIAGVYINRLKKKLPLQACPTVIFAMGGERPKRVLKKHLEYDSPYNTYKNPGLPPGPIRFVSTQAINAVLNYSKHNYLYFSAKEDFSGSHYFSTSLSQHNAYAARYQRALDKAGIR